MVDEKEEHVGFGQCAFAVAPGHFLDSHNATAATVDAPHGVQNEDEEPPEGNELKASFGELVITIRREMATRADCGRTLARSYGHFDALPVGTETGVLVDKTRKRWQWFRIVISSIARKQAAKTYTISQPAPAWFILIRIGEFQNGN